MADIRTTGLLDDFERPTETPLAGPTGTEWNYMESSRPELELTGYPPSGSGTANNTSSGSIWYSLWDRDVFPEGDVEVWGKPVGGEAGAAITGWRMGFMMASSVPGSGTMDGYLFLRESALGDFIYFRRYTNNSSVDLTNTTGPLTEDYNPWLLARRVGNDLEAWVSNDAGTPVNWSLICRTTDATYHGPWQIFIGIEDPSHAGTGWQAFGGGSESVTWKPHIIRRDWRLDEH